MLGMDLKRDIKSVENFQLPDRVFSDEEALAIVIQSLRHSKPKDSRTSHNIFKILQDEFPDQEHPEKFWNNASKKAFRDFFVWGHDHDFGFGYIRQGAMSTRHIEITAEGISLGMMPQDLNGKQILDIGCWTGGDLLVLSGLGARVTALEEHGIAANAAKRLTQLLEIEAQIYKKSVYEDDIKWSNHFDFIYCSGVIYHVTDPMLFLRILFAYTKVGGSIYLETKAFSDSTGESVCSYSGTLEKGWNWYAPNEIALGRWMVDAGFDAQTVRISRRKNNRLIASATKTSNQTLRETAGFSRPNSWLEGYV